MANHFAVGLDFGTNSVRALIVDVADGREVAGGEAAYPSGENGILSDGRDPNVARQHPADYLTAMQAAMEAAVFAARNDEQFAGGKVVGIGVDTTASTPIPVDSTGEPLAMQLRFHGNLDAMAWLWKDHAAHEEAALITARARELRPQYLAKCGGAYSSEWFWSKVLHCARVAPDVFDRAHSWVEMADWIPAVLTGGTIPEEIARGVCAAGHKGLYHPEWGGYPDAEFLTFVDDRLVRLLRTLPRQAYNISTAAGALTPEWASRLKLAPGIPVAVGGIDAHMGAVGSGVAPGTLVKIIGTSGCDLTVVPLDAGIPDIAGICGMVPESVLPGCVGIEAGQAAVGDLFKWFVECVRPESATHASLTEEASRLSPGQSGLLALDWHNGNRDLLADPRLSGLVLGLSLGTRPAEIYRSLVEATAFGARAILDRMRENGVAVDRVVCGGGIAAKNRMLLQIYADVLGCRMELAGSTQTCALGSAMAGAVVAGEHADFASAAKAMTRVQAEACEPDARRGEVYDRLYGLWRSVHDAFGVAGSHGGIGHVMKELLDMRDAGA